MVKFLKSLLKKIGVIRSGNFSPAPKSENVQMIEDAIDTVVCKYIVGCKNLLALNADLFYWQAVVKAICYAESEFNLFETFFEKDLANKYGLDPVTGMRYLSEGLMQLSYSDAISYHCDFDLKADRTKSEKDPTKSIFDAEKNIQCGLTILNKMVEKHGHFIFNSGNYWATLKPSNKRHKVYLNKFNEYQGGHL